MTIKEIKEQMWRHKVNNTKLANAFEIDKSTISSHLSGRYKSRLFKVSCFYYFKYLEEKTK